MTNFRNNYRRLACLVTVLGAVTAVRPALGADPAPAGRDEVAAPAPAPDAAGFDNPFGPVESEPLSDLSAGLVGLIDPAHGGFGADLWSGTGGRLVETLLPRLPLAASSPAMMDLERRLLLSRSRPPQGATSAASVLAAQLDRAIEIGQIGAVEPIAQQVPDQMSDPGVLGARVDAFLYQGADNEACGLAESARGHAGDPAWTKRLAFCDALAGKVSEARMGVDVLADTGDRDPAFASLMSKLVDKARVKEVMVAAPSGVDFALLRHTEVALEAGSLDSASPAFLTAWAAFAKAPESERLMAAERAVTAGVLPAAALVNLYTSVKLAKGLTDKPFEAKLMPGGPQGAAYAIQRLARTQDDSERGHLIAAALQAARARGALPGVALVLHDDLTALEADAMFDDIAATLGEGEVTAGENVTARRWYDLLHAQGADASEPAEALRSLLAVRGGAPDLGWAPNAFLERLNGTKSPDEQARAALEWNFLRALGTPNTPNIWLQTLNGPLQVTAPAPMTGVIEGLNAAAAKGRVGETVLFALVAIGDAGPRGAHPAALVAAVQALSRIGLTNEASAIAAEALAWRMP